MVQGGSLKQFGSLQNTGLNKQHNFYSLKHTTMKITQFKAQDGINAASHRKENYFAKEYALIYFAAEVGFKTIATLRIYSTRTNNYACLWINNPVLGLHATGSDRSDSQDHAIYCAARSAGIHLDVQTYAPAEELLAAIAEYMGCKNYTIHIAHA